MGTIYEDNTRVSAVKSTVQMHQICAQMRHVVMPNMPCRVGGLVFFF